MKGRTHDFSLTFTRRLLRGISANQYQILINITFVDALSRNETLEHR